MHLNFRVLSVNQRKWMLDSWSMHNYEQNLALDYMKTYLVCDLCLLGFDFNVHCVLHVLGVWSVFVRKFYVFVFFLFVLGLIICFVLVLGQTMVFSSIQG
jgi:hypothetical protein